MPQRPPTLHDERQLRAARAHLAAGEPVMAELVERYGEFWPPRPRSPLRALVGLVLDQQISVHAAAAIRKRLNARLRGRWSAASLAALDEADLAACGLSTAKRRTLAAILAAQREGQLDWRRLSARPDPQVLEALTQIHGIGPWTAQMFLLFALGRPDVLAPADLGLQNAARAQYRLPSRPDAAHFSRLAQPWQPYRSLASVCLWASLERGNWRPRPGAS
jgi:DNA-3-methyladenine glycosylase II